jgi:hypothetical protein
LLVGQQAQRAIDVAKRSRLFLAAARADCRARFLRDEGFGPALARPLLVNPQVAHHRVHPAVEARVSLPLVALIQRPEDRRLAQVVPVGGVTRKACGKPPQPGQQRQHALFKGIARNRVFASFMD